MAIYPYLNFGGNCREAIAFYAEVFGSPEPDIMTWDQAPPGPDGAVPEEYAGLVMHAELAIGDSVLMLSDSMPDGSLVVGNNITLTIMTEDRAALESQFVAMSDGGTVEMELQETFFAELYGMLTDRFGVPWQFLIYKEDMTG